MTDHDLILAGDTLSVIRGELGRSPLSASARRTYLGALAAFERWREGRQVTKLLLEEYAAHLLSLGRSPGTVNHALTALRWWAHRMADRTHEQPGLTTKRRAEMIAQAQRAAEVASVRGESAQRGRHVSDGEIRALLEACMVHDTEGGTRDAALIAVAFATGMRRAELCALDLGDVASIDEGYELTIRRAKGGKTRVVAVYNGARDYLRDWLTLRGDDPGPLFLAVRKDGVILDHGLSPAALQAMLGKRALQAGVTNVHWHDARRTMAGELLDRGADLSTVQKLLGHSSPVTTSAYDRRPEETRRKALRGLHMPYLGPRQKG